MQATRPKDPQEYPWSKWTDETLLSIRICDLGLRLTDSVLEARIDRVHFELTQKGLIFQPRCYLTSEWLCPDRVPRIGIPFCLAHCRLRDLEKSQMLEVEGNTEHNCMKLLRHEAGHTINYAYRLYQKSRWRELFGPISEEYTVRDYFPRKYSRAFVVHLPENYAQAHPDEDFAETFATWLTPGLDWEKRYRGTKAIKKLEYVDHLMAGIGSRAPVVPTGPKLWPVERLRSTLQPYYRKKQRDLGDDYHGFYDEELCRIFARNSSNPGTVRTSVFLRKHRKFLTNQIVGTARLKKYEVAFLIRRIYQRTQKLELYLRGDEPHGLVRLSISLTAHLYDQREIQRSA